MKKKALLTFILAVISVAAFAQQGNHITQISAQLALPTGDLSNVSNVGYGGAAKGMYGFSSLPQHITFEFGYNYFPVKDLPSDVSAYYSNIPLLLGYRYSFKNFHIESQAGISINRIEGTVSGINRSDSSSNFAFGLGISYSYKDVELGVKYQSSDTKNDNESISFVGIRLGYNFNL